MSQASAMILATTLTATGNRETQEVTSAMNDMFFGATPMAVPENRLASTAMHAMNGSTRQTPTVPTVVANGELRPEVDYTDVRQAT